MRTYIIFNKNNEPVNTITTNDLNIILPTNNIEITSRKDKNEIMGDLKKFQFKKSKIDKNLIPQ